MKRFIRKITIAVLLIAFGILLLPHISRAAVFEASTSVESFTQAGYTNIHLSVHNDSNAEMSNIRFECGGSMYPTNQSIAPGQSQDFDIYGFEVSEDMIGQSLTIIMKWNENGEEKQLQSLCRSRTGELKPPPPHMMCLYPSL